jgi:hypothetical protein
MTWLFSLWLPLVLDSWSGIGEAVCIGEICV